MVSILKNYILKRINKSFNTLFKTYSFFQTVKFKRSILWEPKAERIITLAPHMDDEVIGCGGALAKHAQKGADITVVFLTDGNRTNKAREKDEFIEKWNKQKGGNLRKQEAELALKKIGVRYSIFLDYRENQIDKDEKIREEVKKYLRMIKPEIVYLPSFLEEHPDHLSATKILLDSTEKNNINFLCCCYEIWTPLYYNCLVDIEDVIVKKKEAIGCYKSQLKFKDYIHAISGINAYRSISILGKTKYVEAFLMLPLNEYRKLYKNCLKVKLENN